VSVEAAEGQVEFASGDPEAFAVKVLGDAMAPRIEHGEYVIVEPGAPLQAGRDVYVRLLDGRAAVRRFAYERDGRVHLESINKSHPSQTIDLDQVVSIFPVAARVDSSRFRSR